MRPTSCGIMPEGLPAIGLCAFSACIFALIGCWPVAVLFVLLTWFSCHFFRDPERVTPQEPGLAISPADGRIICIEARPDPLTGQMRTCMGIFMNVFSVHVNRAPVTGMVEHICYFPGKYFNASWDKASTDNERCTYLLRDSEGSPWIMVQIAGLLARRIVCHAEEGDTLSRGQRFGMIRFGSRVDLYLPQDYSPAVSMGEQVFAGQSLIARKNT